MLAPLCVFGALAEEVWSHEGFGWDAPLMRFVHGYATPTRDALMISVSTVGGARGMIPLCVLAVAGLAWTVGLHLILTSRVTNRSRQWRSTRLTPAA